MNNSHCPQCEAQVYGELPGGLCPTCLMAAARKSQAEIFATQAPNQESQTPSMDDMARLFPELEILEFVGRGGMGAVYKVRQRNLDRIVALKVFLYRSDDPEFAARFQREARALARLNHPNIVTVHDFGVREYIHYLIMEFVDGLNLRQITAEEKLTPEMALQMVPQLCDALQYAHDRGVIHRDIKPENLLLDVDGKINIADFGLAKMTGNAINGTLTHTQQVMGTINYMAPEQRERPTEVDHRADIYSLGVVIYEMLTGELPLGRFQPPSSKSNLNAELDEVVMRALEREPERRYQQASEFKSGFLPYEHQPAVRKPVAPVKSNTPIYENTSDAPRGTRCMITVMSGREKKGSWVPGDPQLVFTAMAGATLDLTEVKQKHVDLTLFTLMGAVDVIVPPGANVDLDGFILMGASDDHVAATPHSDGMNVRIRSWGAMGGVDVRSPSAEEVRVKQSIKLHEQRSEEDHVFGEAMVAIYKMFATLVTIAIPIVFLCGAFDILPDNIAKPYGSITAIACCLFWSQVDYVRILVGAGPENTDPETLQKHYSSSKSATSVRMFALTVLFACPALFILAAFEGEKMMRLAAIICGVSSIFFFVWADKLDELLGKRAAS